MTLLLHHRYGLTTSPTIGQRVTDLWDECACGRNIVLELIDVEPYTWARIACPCGKHGETATRYASGETRTARRAA